MDWQNNGEEYEFKYCPFLLGPLVTLSRTKTCMYIKKKLSIILICNLIYNDHLSVIIQQLGTICPLCHVC